MTDKQKGIAKNIMLTLGVVGVVTVVAVAPGLAKLLPTLTKINPARINQEIKRLQKRGLVEVIKRKNGLTSIRLTKLGRERLSRLKIEQLKIETPAKWDTKWRLVTFDVPVYRNSSRNTLRRTMKQLGFYPLQQSVFVHPYPCFEEIHYLREYLGLNARVEYMEVANLESQDKLLEYFFT